jgi:hypothetical protein
MANRDVILSLSKDPLTSILSPGGERKTKVSCNHRGKEGDFSFSGGGLLCADGQVRPHAEPPDIPFSQQTDQSDLIGRLQLVEAIYCVDERTRNDVIDLVLISFLENIVNFI